MNKKFFFAIANWKLNGNKKIILNYINKLNKIVNKFKKLKIIISPPIIYLDYINNLIINNNLNDKLYTCSQNIDTNYSGSFTGETSVYMLNEFNVSYVIIGHSERRILHKETNKNILKKIIISKSNNITPILCIGENNNDYLNNKSSIKCINQIKEIINKVGIKILYNIILAYEPIWSIGTNISANKKHIENITSSILDFLYKKDKDIIKKINIVYGGSVSEKNINDFLNLENIKGILIGKSSLDIDKFSKILNIIENLY